MIPLGVRTIGNAGKGERLVRFIARDDVVADRVDDEA
jgi:hypothetical protein